MSVVCMCVFRKRWENKQRPSHFHKIRALDMIFHVYSIPKNCNFFFSEIAITNRYQFLRLLRWPNFSHFLQEYIFHISFNVTLLFFFLFNTTNMWKYIHICFARTTLLCYTYFQKISSFHIQSKCRIAFKLIGLQIN